ncbi:MAG: lipid-A-disaccharide synthase [Acidobacteria bacterium]|nr:lipid-A-disaccharide synthase [Acidobacteriota bacterium]
MKLLISAGEESGDQYAAGLVEALRLRLGPVEFFGCAGPRLRAAGVRPIVEAERLAVVGLVEVLSHLPRIYQEFRKLTKAAERERPDLAILTDSPDFHLRLAKRLARSGIPVVYLIAPQAWAWRRWRVRLMRRVVTRLLCIFPFEEPFFRQHGVAATYIGHPLAGRVRPSLGRAEFFRKHRLAADRPLIAALPGSRRGEAARHLPLLVEAARELNAWRAMTFVLAASRSAGAAFFVNRITGSGIQVIEGETYDVLAHADLALVASGTATIEAALLGTPMVTFYRVHPASWFLGKWFVDVPFFSMVNLLAERRIVPELIQADCTSARLAAEARALLEGPDCTARIRADLGMLKSRLAGGERALDRAAEVIAELLSMERTGVRNGS